MVTHDRSFGDWLRQRRRVLDLTQEELAQKVGCSTVTLRKLEAESRRPSKQIAERLAEALLVAPDDRPAFLRFARGDPFAAPARSEDGPNDRIPEPAFVTQPTPTGTVAFLFTDIEGSTGLAQRYPTAMPALLARHHAILRHAIAAHNGHVFQVIGDAFCAAFHTTREALLAALEAQRALQREAWEPATIKVRMGLHAGTARAGASDPVSGGYSGYAAMARTQHIMVAAHGDQVLLSSAAAELARAELPTGVSLRDLGQHWLKGLVNLEQLWQMVARELDDDFPLLQSDDTRPNNLPTQVTPFIGRARELEAVCQRLLRPDVRLLTLTGPGGTGKTRLSLQAAADLLDDFADGVFFVSLAPIGDPALVPSAITRALGLEGASGRSPLEAAKNYLGEKRLLLVLDNFEQVTAAAPLVAELLGAAPGMKVLITSRNVLHLYGEHDYAVPPLSLPDPKQLPPLEGLTQYEALQLFIERAQAAKADFTVTNENARAVAQICQHLDGLPLAIELAAARIRLLAPHDILARLGHRLKLLTGGGRDLPARHQTLRGAITWSYDLLDESERRLFARLAVFVGGCALEAAEAVCSEANHLPVDVFDGIESLADQSLVQRAQGEGQARFIILATIREYALEVLEQLEASGQAGDVRRRHAEYYLALAVQGEAGQYGPEPRAWLSRLETEHDNLRAALEWAQRNDFKQALQLASALGWFWFARGYRLEGLQRLQSLVTRPEASGRTAARARALVELVALEQYSSAAVALADEAISIYQELDDKPGLALACHWRAITAYQAESRYELALNLFQEALTLFRQFGNHWGITRALSHMGIIHSVRGDYPGSRKLLEESLALCREAGDKRGSANVLVTLGTDAEQVGDLERARALLEESVALYREWGDSLSVTTPLCELGEVLGRQGDYALARQKVDEAYRLDQKSGEKQLAAYDLWIVGRVALAEGDAARAKKELRECLVLGHKHDGKAAIAFCVPDFARLAALSPGQAGRVARLLAAGERLIEGIAGGVQPSYRVEWDQAAAAARLELGEAAFAAAWAEGRAMTQNQTVEYALAVDG